MTAARLEQRETQKQIIERQAAEIASLKEEVVRLRGLRNRLEFPENKEIPEMPEFPRVPGYPDFPEISDYPGLTLFQSLLLFQPLLGSHAYLFLEGTGEIRAVGELAMESDCLL